MKAVQKNPFIYSTPDQIKDPQEALNLFVDVFEEFYLIESTGNTFINGARGTGKSMMFRIMRPDCQKIRLGKPLCELNYYAINIPIKDTSMDFQELEYLKGHHGENILNEHLMVIYFSLSIIKCLSSEDINSNYRDEAKKFYSNVLYYLSNAGYATDKKDTEVEDYFKDLVITLESLLLDFSNYIERLSLGAANFNYSGALCSYRNFLLPLIKDVNRFSFLPKDKPIYLLIDDADLLNITQTRLLNTWVSFRSTSIVCFKITTQLNYKTFYTSNSLNKIDSPHDYHEINLSDIYTSNMKGYRKNIKDMVERRLKVLSDINVPAEEFFPENRKQAIEYAKIFDALKNSKGYDYAYRNARLDFMLSLKNEYTYSYAGFDQLVHLSSGIIRNFIDLSFKMFDNTLRKQANKEIKFIPPEIQDDVAREYSNWFFQQLDKPIDDKQLDLIQVNKFRSLKDLVNSLGKAFRLFLESDTTERRKFSFYYDGYVKDEVKDVLKLGISEGYLHYSTQGSKSGLGRSHKYVLNRILSPIFLLDPFTFSGYLYLTPERIELAVRDEKKFLSYIKNRINSNDTDDFIEKKQLEMDFNDEFTNQN